MNVSSRRFLVVMAGGTGRAPLASSGGVTRGTQAAQVHGISHFEEPPDEAVQYNYSAKKKMNLKD